MRLTFSKRNLNRGLNLIAPVIEKKPAIPVLETVRIDAGRWGDPIRFQGTNLDCTLEVEACGEIHETGAVCVNYRELKECVKAIDNKDEITLESWGGGESTFISFRAMAGNRVFDFKAVNEINEYPDTGIRRRVYCHNIPGARLRSMLQSTRYGASDEVTRYFLHGVRVECRKDKTIFVTTDGRRMAVSECEKLAGLREAFNFTIPTDAVRLALKTFKDSKMLRMGIKDMQLWIKSEDAVLTSRALEGEYPKWEQIIPDLGNYEHKVYANREALLEAVDRILKVPFSYTRSSKTQSLMDWDLLTDHIKLSAESRNDDEPGSDECEVEIENGNGNLELSFDGKYWSEALSNIDSEKVTLQFQSALSAAIITPVGVEEHMDLIMPMRRDNWRKRRQ